MSSCSIVSATIWSSIQRFGGLAVSFISNMVLARMLSPNDFGTVGLIMVFVVVADVLVDGGLGNALIQKKIIEEDDKKTIFTANLLFSLLLFGILFFTAPVIESFTNVSKFSLFLRVQSICVLIRAFYIVNISQLNRDFNFSALAKITLFSQIASTIIAILMAYCGMGVWSLLFKTIILDFSCCILYAIVSPFKFRLYFNKKSFYSLFSFGFPVAIANIIESLFANIVSFVIGKTYSVKDLGYFNQANSLKQIPVYSVSAIINQVFFPYFSKIQDDTTTLRLQYQNTIRFVTFFIYPILSYLIFFANPAITLLYSEKWIPCVPIFQILCLSGYFNALYHLSRSTIKSIGKSKLLLKTQILSLIISLVFVFVFLSFSIQTFVWVIVIDAIITYSIVGFYIGKYLNYSLLKQIYDWIFTFLISIIIAYVTCELSKYTNFSMIIEFVMFFLVNIILYFTISIFLKNEISVIVISIIKNRIKNNV